jgi:hypothetical protein
MAGYNANRTKVQDDLQGSIEISIKSLADAQTKERSFEPKFSQGNCDTVGNW